MPVCIEQINNSYFVLVRFLVGIQNNNFSSILYLFTLINRALNSMHKKPLKYACNNMRFISLKYAFIYFYVLNFLLLQIKEILIN